MSEITEHKINKTEWPKGPWMCEPDRIQWKHADFACLLVRNSLGALCGYVGVDAAHPYYGRQYDGCEVAVHGGLTYADKCLGAICHVPEAGMPDDVWWLGFDCAHSGDLVPGMSRYSSQLRSHEVYRDLEYVRQQTNQLAEQLRAKANA